MPGCGSGVVVLPWSSPRSQHHAAMVRKNHTSRLFRFSEPPLEKETLEELQDVEFRLEQFEKHGVKEKLDKQIALSSDLSFCENVDEIPTGWHGALDGAVTEAEEELVTIEEQQSEYNADFFERYAKKIY